MVRYKKYLLLFISISYILLTMFELVKYLFCKSSIFGLIYLMLSTVIIFLLVPTTINYNNKFSWARISKLLIVVVFGIFLSYFLNMVVFKSINYTDYSYKYIESIFVIKNIIKPILYFILLLLAIVESNVIEIIREKIQANK